MSSKKNSAPEGPHENEVHEGLIELPLAWGGIAVVDRTQTQVGYCVDMWSHTGPQCELMFTVNGQTWVEHVEHCAGHTMQLLLGLPIDDEGEEVGS
jgi:hypothetical protein